MNNMGKNKACLVAADCNPVFKTRPIVIYLFIDSVITLGECRSCTHNSMPNCGNIKIPCHFQQHSCMSKNDMCTFISCEYSFLSVHLLLYTLEAQLLIVRQLCFITDSQKHLQKHFMLPDLFITFCSIRQFTVKEKKRTKGWKGDVPAAPGLLK